MARTLKNKLATHPEERRARIAAEADRLQAEYRTLKELRKARELTQVQLAEALGIRQATVAQMEKRSDLLLSTLRGYVEAMGGPLKLIVEFPGKQLSPLTAWALRTNRRGRERKMNVGWGSIANPSTGHMAILLGFAMLTPTYARYVSCCPVPAQRHE